MSKRFKKSSTQPFSLKVFPFHSFSSFAIALYLSFIYKWFCTHNASSMVYASCEFVKREQLIRRIVVITHQLCAGRSTFQSCERGSFIFGNRLWLRTFFPSSPSPHPTPLPSNLVWFVQFAALATMFHVPCVHCTCVCASIWILVVASNAAHFRNSNYHSMDWNIFEWIKFVELKEKPIYFVILSTL